MTGFCAVCRAECEAFAMRNCAKLVPHWQTGRNWGPHQRSGETAIRQQSGLPQLSPPCLTLLRLLTRSARGQAEWTFWQPQRKDKPNTQHQNRIQTFCTEAHHCHCSACSSKSSHLHQCQQPTWLAAVQSAQLAGSCLPLAESAPPAAAQVMPW